MKLMPDITVFTKEWKILRQGIFKFLRAIREVGLASASAHYSSSYSVQAPVLGHLVSTVDHNYSVYLVNLSTCEPATKMEGFYPRFVRLSHTRPKQPLAALTVYDIHVT